MYVSEENWVFIDIWSERFSSSFNLYLVISIGLAWNKIWLEKKLLILKEFLWEVWFKNIESILYYKNNII